MLLDLPGARSEPHRPSSAPYRYQGFDGGVDSEGSSQRAEKARKERWAAMIAKLKQEESSSEDFNDEVRYLGNAPGELHSECSSKR